VQRANPVIALATGAVAKHPPARLVLFAIVVLFGFDAQVEAAAVVVPAAAGSAHLEFVQLPDNQSFGQFSILPSTLRHEIERDVERCQETCRESRNADAVQVLRRIGEMDQ
jgi:hypothetical protein